MTLRLPLALLVGAIVAFASAAAPAGDPDGFWHIVIGRDLLRDGLARTDTFSWTVPGVAVLTDQWLGQLGLGLAYETAGWRGVVVLRALVGGAAVALTAFAALAERSARPLVGVLATLPALLLMRIVWTERPQLLAFALFAALVIVIRAAWRGDRRAPWAGVPLLMFWANLHSSYVLGLVLLVASAVALRRRDTVVAAALAVGATLLTPAWAATLAVPSGHFLAPPRYIQEWAVPDLLTPAGLLVALTLAAVMVTALLGAPKPREALILLPVAFISLTAVRHAPFLAIAAAPYLAAHGPSALHGLAEIMRLRVPVPASVPAPRSLGALTLALAAVVLAGVPVIAPAGPDLRTYPVAALPALDRGAGLFNEYDWGGFLIFHAPATKVFIDGRLSPYVPHVVNDYTTIIEAHPGWRETIARRGVTQLLVRPGRAVAVRARELGWREAAAGPGFVVLDVPR